MIKPKRKNISKPSSKCGGYHGVELFKGRYRALTKKDGQIRYLPGDHTSPESAEDAFDKALISRKDILIAWPTLNFPEKHRALYEKRQAEESAQKSAAAKWSEDRLLLQIIDPISYPEIVKSASIGTPVATIALRLGVHVDVVIAKLRELETERLRSIGMAVPQVEANSGQTLPEQIAAAHAAGESARSLASRLGVDRKTISRWLGLSSAQTEEVAHENDEA